MSKRVTYKEYKQQQEERNFPKFQDSLVDLKVSVDTPEVNKLLRLVGHPICFWEYNAKRVWWEVDPDDPAGKKKIRMTEDMPFPDADTVKKPTRIGLDDREECPWYKAGYAGTKRYAINCFEKNGDSWTPKVLCKGAGIFNPLFDWQAGRVSEAAENEDDTLTTFLGGKVAPPVRIQAKFKRGVIGNVEYTVHVTSKDMPITDEMVEALRSVGEPDAEVLAKLRKEYKEDQKADPDLHDWHDWFVYGYAIDRMFKYDQYPSDDTTTVSFEEPKAATMIEDSNESEDQPQKTSKPNKTPKVKEIDPVAEDEEYEVTW